MPATLPSGSIGWTPPAPRLTEAPARSPCPLVPFPQFTANEMAGKGDIVYLVYHQQPWDISFTFVPYEDWAEG